MKTVLIILSILIFGSCKKKNTEPNEATTPNTPAHTNCQTGKSYLAGKYRGYSNLVKDTFEIRFLNNRCPKENANIYTIIGLSKAAQPITKPNMSVADKTYTISTGDYEGENSQYTFAVDVENKFSITFENGILTLEMSEIYSAYNMFVKIK